METSITVIWRAQWGKNDTIRGGEFVLVCDKNETKTESYKDDLVRYTEMCNISHCVRSSGQAGMPVTVTRRAQWGKNGGINWC